MYQTTTGYNMVNKSIALLIFFLVFQFYSVNATAVDSTATLVSAATDSAKHTVFDVQSATQKYLDMLPAAARAKSDAYFEGGYWLQLSDLFYAVLMASVFLKLGLSGRIKKVASKVRNINLQNLIYGVIYFIAAWILNFPYSVYKDYYREHQYGLSNLTFLQWLNESAIGLALGVVFGSIILVVIYIAIRNTGKKWWVWGTGITMLFAAFAAFIAPVFIAPLFNKYQPLAEGELKQQILSMARANNIPADNVYQFDASKQSKRISANVSGFASTTRISLNDNLLNRCSPAEIKAVMGHEMGHYVLNHVYKGMVEIGVLIFIAFALVDWLFSITVKRWGAGLGIEDIKDIAGLPLLVLLFTVVMFFATPVNNTITRTQEVEADMFGLNAAQEPDGFASTAMKLSEYRKISPGYWEEIFFFDHPSGRNRVMNAMRWKAEHLEPGE
jgi:STE24 endopeptidase